MHRKNNINETNLSSCLLISSILVLTSAKATVAKRAKIKVRPNILNFKMLLPRPVT